VGFINFLPFGWALLVCFLNDSHGSAAVAATKNRDHNLVAPHKFELNSGQAGGKISAARVALALTAGLIKSWQTLIEPLRGMWLTEDMVFLCNS
jgi:hypothetical protein